MLSWLRRFIADAPRRRARRLARDAHTVATMVRQTYRESAARAAADRVQETLLGTDAVDADADALARWQQRLRSLHTDARRSQDEIGLTALTLAIIDSEARTLGLDGEIARQAVAAFVADPLGDRDQHGAPGDGDGRD